jgi:hypothetical protein
LRLLQLHWKSKREPSNILPWCFNQQVDVCNLFLLILKSSIQGAKKGAGTECTPKHYKRQHSPFFSEINIGR